MGKLTKIVSPPKFQTWKLTIDARNIDKEKFLGWVENSTKGECFYSIVQFDKGSPHKIYKNRTRNIKNGYSVIYVWFKRKQDAALCRLWWPEIN